MIVQCISKRPGHRDTSYNTGDWKPFQFKDVPDEIGRLMLGHKDVYAKPTKKPNGEIEKVVIDNSEEENIRDMHAKIALMSKEQVKTFIERNYKQSVDLRSFKAEGSINRHALMLFNQYGGD